MRREEQELQAAEDEDTWKTEVCVNRLQHTLAGSGEVKSNALSVDRNIMPKAFINAGKDADLLPFLYFVSVPSGLHMFTNPI